MRGVPTSRRMCRDLWRTRRWLLVGVKVSTGTRKETQAAQPVHTGRKYIGPNRRQPRMSMSWKAAGEIWKMIRYSLDAVWSGKYWHCAGGAMYLKSSCSMVSTLNEDFESFAEVLRVGEGLELGEIRSRRIRSARRRPMRPGRSRSPKFV